MSFTNAGTTRVTVAAHGVIATRCASAAALQQVHIRTVDITTRGRISPFDWNYLGLLSRKIDRYPAPPSRVSPRAGTNSVAAATVDRDQAETAEGPPCESPLKIERQRRS